MSLEIDHHNIQSRYVVGFGLVEMAILANPKSTIYRNFYVNYVKLNNIDLQYFHLAN